MQRKHSNKENINPIQKKKENASSKSQKKTASNRPGKGSSISKDSSSGLKLRQRELSKLKNEVRKMRKQVELFKTYYITQTQSYRSIEDSQTPEPISELPSQLKYQHTRSRSLTKEEEYLINGSQSLTSREQSEYYIQYYLDN